jgi:hypothetical protein
MMTHHPLHGSQRAGLPHWALASGDNAKSPQGIGMANGWKGQPAPHDGGRCRMASRVIGARSRRIAWPSTRSCKGDAFWGHPG